MITPEMFELIPKINISTPEGLAAFKKWQNEDGTIEGLRKLYEAQQKLHPTPESLATSQAVVNAENLSQSDGESNPAQARVS